MSAPQDDPDRRARYWPVELLRAVPALAVGGAITFSQDHSPRLGLIAFAGFTLATSLVHVWAVAGRRVGAGGRSAVILQAVVGIVLGVFALVSIDGHLAHLLYALVLWAAVTGALELYLGIRSRSAHPAARDWVFGGLLTLAFAVGMLLLPADFRQPLEGSDASGGTLTSAVIAVGAFGAYSAVIGVYLVIGALSLKWATPAPSHREVD